MLHIRNFDATLHVRNPISLCINKTANVMLLLRNLYEGKNLKGSHIVRIREISKISSCRITSNNISGEGDVDVCFLADVAVVARWDIVPGLNVMRTEQVIVGSTDINRNATDLSAAKIAASLLNTPEAKTLRVGQKIAIRVIESEHAYMQNSIAVVGALLTCDRTAQTYRLKGSLTQDAATSLMPIVDAIGKELADRADLSETRAGDVMFFEMLLYAYASPPKALRDAATNTMVESVGATTWEGPPSYVPVGDQASVVNLLDLVRKVAEGGGSSRVDGLWSRPLGVYRSSPLVAHSARIDKKSGTAQGAERGSGLVVLPDGWKKPVEEDTVVTFQTFLSGMLNFLYAVRMFVTVFDTKTAIDEHFNIWAAMRTAQTPLPGLKK
jgi:hypothetical protein